MPKRLIPTLIVVATVVVIGTGMYLFLATDVVAVLLGQTPGYFDRPKLEAVVAHVRLLQLAPGTDHQLRLDDPQDPQSLRALKPGEYFGRGQGAGNVWARVTPAGHLTVVIETRDLGHAGVYGFAFADVPLAPKPQDHDNSNSWSTIDIPGPLKFVLPSRRIDDHWWKVEYNLD